MDLSFNLAPSYQDLKDPTSCQNFDDTVEQKRVIDLRACHKISWEIVLIPMNPLTGLLFSQDNYNKKIAPFTFDKVKNVNIPVNVNVSMSVIDIIKIEEVDHVYILKFRLVLEWYSLPLRTNSTEQIGKFVA